MKSTCLYGLLTLFLLSPRASVAENILVVGADAGALYGEGGHVFSLSDLFWTTNEPVWEGVIGQRIHALSFSKNSLDVKRNRYGDITGKIMSSKSGWLQRNWIEQGLAVLKGSEAYSKEVRFQLLEAERSAFKRAYQDSPGALYSQASELERVSYQPGFKIVTGKVTGVQTVRGVTYMNFGEDWRKDFTAAISSKNLSKFKKKNWKLISLENKWIEVRGQVRDYNGPYMNLIFPEQVVVLPQPLD